LIDTIVAATRPGIEARLKQPMVVENRTGGGGQIGMQAIALAAPDGYTFGIVPSNTMVISQFLFKSSIDPLRDFVPVTVLVDVPLLLAVTAKHPVPNNAYALIAGGSVISSSSSGNSSGYANPK